VKPTLGMENVVMESSTKESRIPTFDDPVNGASNAWFKAADTPVN